MSPLSIAPSASPTLDFVTLALRVDQLPEGSEYVLRLVDGRRTVDDIAAVAPLERRVVIELMVRLAGDGFLRFPLAMDAEAPGSRSMASPSMESDPADAITEPELLPVDAVDDVSVDAVDAVELPLPVVTAFPLDSPVASLSRTESPSAPQPAVEVVRFPPAGETRRERLQRQARELELACGDAGPMPLTLASEVVRPGGFPVAREWMGGAMRSDARGEPRSGRMTEDDP